MGDPKIARAVVAAVVAAHCGADWLLRAGGVSFDPQRHVVFVGIRGYYLDSMGVRGRNDRGVYDDCLAVMCPDGLQAFRFNVDPNGSRKGRGTGAGKGMAVLKCGVWLYVMGKHKGRAGFRQGAPVTVIRDGDPPYEDTGWHAINIHDGGVRSTSSLGCQTADPATFARFRAHAYGVLRAFNNPKAKSDWGVRDHAVPYILIDEVGRRGLRPWEGGKV